MSNTSNLSLTVDLSSETLFKQYVSVQDSNWKTVDSAVGSISSDVSTLQSGVSSLQESVSTVISYTDNLALRVSAMEVSISRAFSSISEFHQDLSTVVSDVTELYSLVSDVQNSVKDILSSVQATDLQVSNLQYDVSDLLSSVAYLNSSISGIVSDIEYLSSSISQLSEYVVSVVTSIVDNLSTIYGSEGSITLFSSLWSNSLYEVSISGFGEHDEIVFSAATRSDRSMWMEADPFVVASSKGEVVTFDVLSTPTSDINLFYYINRGLPAVTASTIVVTTLDASDIHDYTEIYVYYDGVETSDFQVVVSGSKVQLLFSEAVVISSVSYILTNFEWEFGVYFSEGPQQVTVNLVGSVSVNWGDGVIDNLSYHTYSSSGSYTAHLNGKINDWGPTFNNTSLITTLSFIEPTPILFGFKATPILNVQLVSTLRVALEQKTVAFPVPSSDIDDVMVDEEDQDDSDKATRLTMEESAIYLEADALQVELGSIVSKATMAGNVVYDTEKKTQHKDRYSALAMGVWYIAQIEEDNKKRLRNRGTACIGIVDSF